MSAHLYRDLAWLAHPPADFNARCRAIADQTGESGRDIEALASFSLDENQLNRLAKLISRARTLDKKLHPLTPFRLGVLSNSTVDFIVPTLVATAARHGIALECISANYDQVMQEALSPASIINTAKPDAVLVAIDFRALPLHSALGSAAESQEAVQRALTYFQTVRAGLKANSKAICILQTLAPPAERLF